MFGQRKKKRFRNIPDKSAFCPQKAIAILGAMFFGASVSDIALTLVSPFLNIDIELVEYPESQYKNAPTYMP